MLSCRLIVDRAVVVVAAPASIYSMVACMPVRHNTRQYARSGAAPVTDMSYAALQTPKDDAAAAPNFGRASQNTRSMLCRHGAAAAAHRAYARCFLKKPVSRSHAAAATPSSYGTKPIAARRASKDSYGAGESFMKA